MMGSKRRTPIGGVDGARDRRLRGRTFAVAVLLLAIAAMGVRAEAQPAARVPKVGLLLPTTAAAAGYNVEALTQGLREAGYVEGKTIALEIRYGEGDSARFPTLARELVSLKPDVLVTSTDPAIAAVRRETRTIPIVMAFSTDPVATGFVASLAHPGGNVTGLSNIASEMSGKRLALLKDALPGLSHVALLWNPDVRGAVLEYKEAEAVARSLRLERGVRCRRPRSRVRSHVEPACAGVLLAAWKSHRLLEATGDRDLRAEASATVHVSHAGVR